METKLANPAPLGLIRIASTTWLLSMVNAGWYDEKVCLSSCPWRWSLAGSSRLWRAFFSFFRGNTFRNPWDSFLSYGAFWVSLATFIKFLGGGAPASFVGWYLFGWGVFSFYMWIATFRHNMVLQLVFLALWITFLLLAVGDWFGVVVSHTAGGYLGLVTALPCGLSLRYGIDQRRIRSDGPSNGQFTPAHGGIVKTPGSFHGAKTGNARMK